MSSKYEVAYCLSSGEGVDIFDIRTGAHLKSYQTSAACTGEIALVDDTHMLLSTGKKPGVVILDWFTGAVRTKCGASEKMGPVAVSSDGLYCAAGALSGKISIWSLLNGALLMSFPAHYKALTSIQFTADGAFLVSASEDAVLRVWLLADVLACGPTADPEPYVTWSQHTLAITQVVVAGVGFSGRVWSCSLDQSVKVWDISSRELVYNFEFDSALRSLQVDPAESFFLAAGADGRVYKTNLLRVQDSQVPQREAFEGADVKFQDPFTALSLSFDGSLLLGTTLRGRVGVWDVQTMQLLHLLEKGRSSYHAVKVVQHAEGLLPIGMHPKGRIRPICEKFTKHSVTETLTPVPYTPTPALPWRVLTSDPYDAFSSLSSPFSSEELKKNDEDSEDVRNHMNQDLLEFTSLLSKGKDNDSS